MQRIVDADGHVLEHPTAMLEYIPGASTASSASTSRPRADGSEWLHFQGRTSERQLSWPLAGTGGLSMEDRLRAAARRAQVQRDQARRVRPRRAPRARWRPTTSSRRSSTRRCSSACPASPTSTSPRRRRNAYNRGWPTTAATRRRACSASPSIVQQRHRARGAHGEEGQGARAWSASSCDPIRRSTASTSATRCTTRSGRCCEDLDLTIGFHPYLATDMPGACRDLGFGNFVAPGRARSMSSSRGAESPASSASHNIFFTQALSNVYDMQTTHHDADLRRRARAVPEAASCIFLEANGGWIVPFLERLDHHYEIFPLGRAGS